ncbi:MAG: Uma2 family endonuclease [Armatimonadetes bacterium]|nr:Uma2 family endonuclease [Armatimonadota bacterium]
MIQKTETDSESLRPGKMTYEEFLAWSDEDTHAEWIAGEVIFLSPASSRHQAIMAFFASIFQHFIEAHPSGIVRIVPFQMKTGAHLSGREPDILFIANDHLDRLKETYLDGPADLVIEIVSPESGVRDRECKFNEYERGRVCEYWVIDYTRKEAGFFILGEDSFFRAVDAAQGIYRSAVIGGLWINVNWLWQEPLPPLMSVLKEWGLLETQAAS